MRSHAQVVVIGGGAVGASILYHLAEAGIADTLLIEKDELTSGSTWHAAGNIPTYATSWLGMRAGNYGWRLYRELGDKLGVPITYRHTGAFWPAHTEERMDLFRHLTGVSKSAGFDLAMITPSLTWKPCIPHYQALADQPGGVIGGIYDPYEGDIDPSQLTQALAKGARDKGAEVARFTEVIGLSRSAAGEWLVATDKGSVTSEIVINAAGFYGAKVAELAGAPAPVTTLEHQYLVTEPLDELEADQALFPLVRDPDIRFYLRRERSSFLLGSYAHEGRPAWPDGPPDAFAHQLFPDSLDDMADVLEGTIAHVPLLAEAGIQRSVNGTDRLCAGRPAAGRPGGRLAEFLSRSRRADRHHPFRRHRQGHDGMDHRGRDGMGSLGLGPAALWAMGGQSLHAITRLGALWAAIRDPVPAPHHAFRPTRQPHAAVRDAEGEGVVFGQIGGWERAFWFDRNNELRRGPDDGYGHLSFRDDEPWREAVRAECEAVRDAVGIMDHGGFTKFEVEGPGAAGFLDRVFCGRLPISAG